MRHSDVNRTMATYTDQRLLDTSAAVELLPDLRLMGPTQRDRTEADSQRDPGDGARTVTYLITYDTDKQGQNVSQFDKKTCSPMAPDDV